MSQSPLYNTQADPILRRLIRTGIIVIAVIIAAIVASIGYSLWSQTTAIVSTDKTTDLVVLLAPFIAIATAIERFLESGFNLYERYALEAVRLIGHSRDTLDWMRTERDNAQKSIEQIVGQMTKDSQAGQANDALTVQFQNAEDRLLNAQSRISESLKAPEYLTIKRSITMIAGLLIGLGVATFAKLTLMNAVGFGVPAAVDVIITGLLIGAGPGPLHDFIGIIKELRNSLASLADLAQGTAVKRAMEAVRETTTAAPGTPNAAASQRGPASATLSPDNPAGTSFGIPGQEPETALPAAPPATLPDNSLNAARAAQRVLRRR